MRDTCEIHARYMYHQRLSRYMRDTCGIHAGYMGDTCGTRNLRGLGRVWGYPSAAASRARDTYLDVFHVYMYLDMYPICIRNVS